jgi:hypothetical protein
MRTRTRDEEFVIARSDSDEAIHTCLAATWIASLTLAMAHPSRRALKRAPLDEGTMRGGADENANAGRGIRHCEER